MHRKQVFALAAVFLVIALVVPPAIVLAQVNNTIYKYIIPGVYPTQGTTNITLILTPQQQQSYSTALTIALILEVIFVALFAVTLYYGYSHTHPEH